MPERPLAGGYPPAVLSMDRTRFWQLYEEDDRMKKHFFCITLALVMCLGLTPGTAFAAEALSTGLDFTSQSGDASGDGYSWTAETRKIGRASCRERVSA